MFVATFFLLFLSSAFAFQPIEGAGSCRSNVYFTKHPDLEIKVDPNEVLTSVNVNQPEHCMGHCRTNNNCFSINVVKTDSMYVCNTVPYNYYNISFKGFITNPSSMHFQLESCQSKVAKTVQVTPTRYARDCTDIKEKGYGTEDGIYTLTIAETGEEFKAVCDMAEDGPWTVFQRRLLNGQINFNRNWKEYKSGFGYLTDEFWLGNERVHLLTKNQVNKLKISFSYKMNDYSAVYEDFHIKSEAGSYQLFVETSETTAPHHLRHHNGSNFATHDRQDPNNESSLYQSGWWFNGNPLMLLNGKHDNEVKVNKGGIYVSNIVGGRDSCSFAEMKFKSAA